MVGDPELCYRALRSRDGRFDGRFFTAVVTTGIYCRPICPARTPRRENVRFFACAAAAEEAGFRPCRRCRPESAPGTPAWNGTSATVSRGLRLIAEGALDGEGVENLAKRLGMTSRHLRRLFLEHVGASPVAVAQTRRAHFAKKLIDETGLSMAQVALSAGFSSVRRFNAAILERFGCAPTKLRAARAGRIQDVPLELCLSYRPPLDWGSMVAFLRDRATPGVEAVDGSAYRRTVEVDGRRGEIDVRPARGRDELLLRVTPTLSDCLLEVVERTRALFDLRADPQRIMARLKGRRVMARLVEARPGIRVPGAWDGFELAVRAILGQQISVKAATGLAGRLAAAYGEKAPEAHDGLSLLFPHPEALARARPERLGMPRTRAASLRGLASAVRDGEISFGASMAPSEVCARLQEIPGIGSWTASYIAMRALRQPDAFPSGDVALRTALSRSKPLTKSQLERFAEAWRPWRAYAAMYLWRFHGLEGRRFDSGAIDMLEMKEECQGCGAKLAAEDEACICSFECTLCPRCAMSLERICPSCGGELVRRPRREKEP